MRCERFVSLDARRFLIATKAPHNIKNKIKENYYV